jgi:hypothetical protein
MGRRTRHEEFLMADAVEVPWVQLAAVAGGLVVLAIVVRGVTAVGRVALGEARYRAGDPDVWLKWVR